MLSCIERDPDTLFSFFMFLWHLNIIVLNKLLLKNCSHLVDRFSLGSQGAMGAVVLGRGLGSATAYLGKYRLTI